MSTLKGDLQAALRGVSKEWKQAKKREDRVHSSRLRQMRTVRSRVTIREAAFAVMEQAYNHASSNGRYYAEARQIMYAARPHVLALTGGECWKTSSYFTQTLLKDYVEQHEPNWKLVWGARGHFYEPHTGHGVDLGGLAVMRYIKQWTNGRVETAPVTTIAARIDTIGPHHRFGTALFIEKEGFAEILADAGIAERYDLAIFSSKGLPVGAACRLGRALHGQEVKILVARDFDLAGFKVAKTLQEGTRLEAGVPVIDIGLRIGDIDGLESEPVGYRQKIDPRSYLRRCGATAEERAFLVEEGNAWRGWSGRRVELNAMTSEHLINWLETKLEEAGVRKIVPDGQTLAATYRRALFRRRLEEAARKLAAELPEVKAPDDLADRVQRRLEEHPAASWDEAIAYVMDEEKARGYGGAA